MAAPHIIVLMTDQQRADCLSCAGHPLVKTPNMDRLAADGVRFSHTYTTSPVCMPARASFLTGLYPHNHGLWYNRGHVPPGTRTYASELAKLGYHTCHIGKSHYYEHQDGEHLDQRRPFMNSLGWRDVFETTGPYATITTDSILTDHWRKVGCLDTFRDDYKRRAETKPAATWPSPLPLGEGPDDFVGHTAVDYISKYSDEKPLLLFVGFGGPHDPWDPPQDWAAQYDPEKMDAPQAPSAPGPWVPPEAAEHQKKLEADRYSPDVARRIRALYYAKISHVDSWFGKIFDALKQRGIYDNSAIVFWSDHGEMLCDKGRIQKSVMYEAAARVPLIVRTPGSCARGAVCAGLASIIDIYPTLLRLAGDNDGSGGFGTPLNAALADPSVPIRDAIFSEIDKPRRTMVRDARYKLVVGADNHVLKLYDLLEDPREDVNLAGRPGTEAVVARLRERLLEWRLSTDLPQREPWQPYMETWRKVFDGSANLKP